jgi:hypothetical protein
MYFTDPRYQQSGMGQGVYAYYRLSPAGAFTRIGMGGQPNGISLSPDGKTLYVASSDGGFGVRAHALADDGAAMGGGMAVTGGGSDGMAVDCAGNLYLTLQRNVRVVSPSGQMLGTIEGFGANHQRRVRRRRPRDPVHHRRRRGLSDEAEPTGLAQLNHYTAYPRSRYTTQSCPAGVSKVWVTPPLTGPRSCSSPVRGSKRRAR